MPPSVVIYNFENGAPDLRAKIEYLKIIDPTNFGCLSIIDGSLCIEMSGTSNPVVVAGITDVHSTARYKQCQFSFPSDRVNLDVMEGRPTQPKSQLLNLPFEVLSFIFEHIGSGISMLTPFSQVARAHKYIFIKVDSWYDSLNLLIDLYIELKQRASGEYGGLTKLPSLGIYIQGIRFRPYHPIGKAFPWGLGDDGDSIFKKSSPIITQATHCHSFYLKLLGEIISDGRALPSLKYLEWADNAALTTPFITALANSRIEHLLLSQPFVDDNVVIDSAKEWPLKDLRINLRKAHSIITPHNINGTSALCASILYRCAATLENLVWKTTEASNDDPQSFGADQSTMPQFLRLRKLELHKSVVFADTHTLDSLLQPPLRYLVANPYCSDDSGAVKTWCFRNRGCISSLETFVWTKADITDEHALDFLRDNNQLLRLSIPQPILPSLLEQRLLPLLSTNFRQLTSLDLSWARGWTDEEQDISPWALRMISQIKTLAQLQLAVYDPAETGWRTGWQVDHESLRENLSPLQKLKKLSLVRDIFSDQSYLYFPVAPYSTGPMGQHRRSYYVTILYRDAEPADPHRLPPPDVYGTRVMEEVAAYAETFPLMEWMYIGQLQFTIRDKEAVRETREMARSEDVRREIFGNKNGW